MLVGGSSVKEGFTKSANTVIIRQLWKMTNWPVLSLLAIGSIEMQANQVQFIFKVLGMKKNHKTY